MRIVLFRLLQIVFAIALLAIAFWPEWGLFYKAIANIRTSPYLVTIGGAIWAILLALNLPLSRQNFQSAGALCLLAVMVAIGFYLNQAGYFDPAEGNQWIILAIFGVGILLGWFTVASHIWRSYRGVYGVDDNDTGE